MATEKILIFDEAGNAKRMKVRIARFLDNEPVTASDKENIRTTLDVDDSLSGTFTTPLSVTSASDSTFTGGGDVGIGAAPGSTRLRVSGGSGQLFKVDDGANPLLVCDATGQVGIGTSSPSHKLTVDSGDIQLQVPSSINTDVQSINWKNTNSSGFDIARIQAATGGNIYEGQIKFLTKDSGGTMATRWTINSSGNLVANGTAIDFGAVASGTGTVTPTTGGLLDDYETGTWTPVFAPDSGSFATATTHVNSAKYTKIGNVVTANCYIRSDGTLDTTGGSGTVQIHGLPFTSAANSSISVSVGYAYGWSAAPAGGYVMGNNNKILLTKRYSTTDGHLIGGSVSDLNTSGGSNNQIMISVTYQTA